MPAHHVGYFMPQNTSQLLFAVHGLKQPPVDKYMAPGAGKRIVNILVNHIKMIPIRLGRKHRENLPADLVDVSNDLRVFYNLKIVQGHFQKLAGELSLLFYGKPGCSPWKNSRADHEWYYKQGNVF